MSVDHSVKIYGQTYSIKGDDPRRIERVALYVDQMMNRLLGGPNQGLSAKGGVLTALNVADEWFKDKADMDRVFSDLNERVDELLSILPE